jgi:hypothetical protein
MAIGAFDESGKYKWGYGSGPSSTADYAKPLAVVASGTSVVVGGNFGVQAPDTTADPGTTLSLAGTTVTAVSAGDVFLARFAP